MAAEDPPPPSAAPPPSQMAHALSLKLLGMSWDGVAKQMSIPVEDAQRIVRAAVGMEGASEDDLLEELNRQRYEALYARALGESAKGDRTALRTAARLLASRPRKSAKPTLDPIRSAIRRGLARGLDAKRIRAEFPECKGSKVKEIGRIVREELAAAQRAPTPQAQRARRVLELEALKRDAPDNKAVLAAQRLLIKLDGSLEPPAQLLHEEIWALVGRLEDFPLPEHIAPPRRCTSEADRRLARAKLRRLRGLLLRAADDVAAFRALGPPPIGAVLDPKDATRDKIGRMSRVNLYAQEHLALALHHAAINAAATPHQRTDSISRIVGTAAVNQQQAETAEWVKELLDHQGRAGGSSGAG